MSYRGHARAVSNALPVPPLPEHFDMSPNLTSEERWALSQIAKSSASRHGNASQSARRAVSRLVEPIIFVLEWMDTSVAMRFTAKRLMLLEMNRLGKPCWAWPGEACLEIACAKRPLPPTDNLGC